MLAVLGATVRLFILTVEVHANGEVQKGNTLPFEYFAITNTSQLTLNNLNNVNKLNILNKLFIIFNLFIDCLF